MDDLTAAVTDLAARLTPEAVERLAAAVAAAGEPGFALRAGIQRALPAGQIRDLGLDLNDVWSRYRETHTAAGIATALLAASHTAAHVRAHQRVELVWTGPPSGQFEARRTDIALHEVIRAAQHDLILMSYASYTLPEVVNTLAAELERGLTLWFLLETADDSDGKFSTDGKRFFEHLAAHGDVRFYRWPLDQRTTKGMAVAAMHAKTAIADDHTLLVTSANLTSAAMTMNMELGLLVRGGHLPAAVSNHYHDLIRRNVIVRHL